MDRRTLLYAPRAQRDIEGLEQRDALRILDDLKLLEEPPWQSMKVKKLRGHEFWEIKSGNFRTIFWPHGNKVVILRIVNRRDLGQTIERIDVRILLRWLEAEGLR
ncbi:MAG: hypothetical protein HY716_01415 [Planctomycetes bacterium]|nr:hypothetical protein [Planctomycetota bacterium]